MAAPAAAEVSPRAASALRCSGLVKHYGEVKAVDGIDLEVPRGICFGLLGPNGAGKTTTLEMIEGLTPPTAGRIELFGMSWSEGRDRELRRRLGVQLQETRLPEKLTVTDLLRLFRSFYTYKSSRAPEARRGRSVEDAIRVVQLEEKRDARVEKLSGGQKQRLSLACALVGDPELLFLDEPTTGLDPQARLKIWEIVDDFRRQGGTVLLTTHYMDEAAHLCERLVILDHGKIIASGTPAELVASLGAEQILELTLQGDAEPPLDQLGTLPGVTSVTTRERTAVLSIADMGAALPALLQLLERERRAVATLTTHQATLEDVFVKLTGRGLRDA
ncbi:MAG TPA: ABC transporter ATP-binding protein [Thermoanaerobaculia bacterium]|jgi:ABC-2 type transport system ATP-binding protein|nr:ABC transporter ATP-binding protein [Thermoanaerobaculia bacterium]